MKIDNSKLDIELARRCMVLTALRSDGVSPKTITRIRKGETVKPVTVGKIAKALGVDPTKIVEMED